MERSVRYIQLENAGYKPALCFRGMKIAHCVINDETCVRVVEIPVKDYDRASTASMKNWIDAVKDFQRIGERRGITQRAIALLDLPPDTVELPELPPDEPADPRGTAAQSAVEDRRVHQTGTNGSSGRQPLSLAVGPAGRPIESRIFQGKDLGLVNVPKPKTTAPPEKRTKRSPSAIGAPRKAVRRNSGPRLPVGEKPTLVRQLAAELGIGEVELRVKLRAAGLRAPYVDIDRMREALK